MPLSDVCNPTNSVRTQFQCKEPCISINVCLGISRSSSTIPPPQITSSPLPLPLYSCDDSSLQDCTVKQIIQLIQNWNRWFPQKQEHKTADGNPSTQHRCWHASIMKTVASLSQLRKILFSVIRTSFYEARFCYKTCNPKNEGQPNMQIIECIFKNNGIQLYDRGVHIKDRQNLNVIIFFSLNTNLSELITKTQLFYSTNCVWEVLLKKFWDKNN